MKPASLFALVLLSPLLFTSCATRTTFSPEELHSRVAMQEQIAKEPLGDYYIGRRYFKTDYKMWGYLRKPRESWADSRLVVLNEDKTLAPDRQANTIGSDNGYEYIVYGKFSGESVYEPAANQFYPEFILSKMVMRANAPAPIFPNRKALDPDERYYPAPY
ncbi:MAG: hypothetical protein WCO60_11660 [Verrucomicrobiota bacterium]